MNNKLTILVPTHSIPSIPKTAVIKQTLQSIFSFKELIECRCIIGYGTHTKPTKLEIKYHTNLIELKKEFPVIEVLLCSYAQQRKNFLNIIKRVETDYFLFIEHDWIFVERLNFNKLIDVMDKYKFINTVFLNKRNNRPLPYPPCGDFILKPEPRVVEIPLLKTSKWSNNPNITRTSVWKDWWYDEVYNAPLNKSNPRKQIEPILHYHYMRDMGITDLHNININKLDFETAHAKWGMYSYGKIGENKMIEHMDGSNYKKNI